MDLFINNDAYYCLLLCWAIYSVGVANYVVLFFFFFLWHIGKSGLVIHGRNGRGGRKGTEHNMVMVERGHLGMRTK